MTNLHDSNGNPQRNAGPTPSRDPTGEATGTQRVSTERAAAAIDEAAEEAYWRGSYAARPYVKEGVSYDFYRPAYRLGWEARERHVGKEWDEISDTLGQAWSADPANFEMAWEEAEPAARDAWERVGTAYPERFATR
ncbi:MAG: hypothetical protein WBV61_08795 [Rhodanobacteraceae bacterium]